ncbi:hypothetical protein BJX65DRAFT_24797 [Aspergillus insuetus]
MYRNMGYVVPGFICMWGKIWFEDKPPRQDSGGGNTVRGNLSIDTSPRECSIEPTFKLMPRVNSKIYLDKLQVVLGLIKSESYCSQTRVAPIYAIPRSPVLSSRPPPIAVRVRICHEANSISFIMGMSMLKYPQKINSPVKMFEWSTACSVSWDKWSAAAR